MAVAVISAPRKVRASKAWKVSKYAVQPVTIRYPDGRVIVQSVEPIRKPRKVRKVRKAKPRRGAGALKTRAITTTTLSARERREREWEILNSVSSDNLIMVDGELMLK